MSEDLASHAVTTAGRAAAEKVGRSAGEGAVDQGAQAARKMISAKPLGIPIWGWAIGLIGGGVLIFVVLPRVFGSAGGPSAANLLPGLPIGAGGGAGDGSTSAPSTPTTPSGPATNDQWLQSAINYLETSLSLDPATARAWLQEYLGGGSPVGGSQATLSLFDKAIGAVTGALGAPPQGVSSTAPGASAFATVGQWLAVGQSILGFAPSGVASEIADLIAGRTTTLSDSADSYLKQIENILGVAPGLPAYSVGTAAPTPPAATPNVPSQQEIQNFQAGFSTYGDALTAFNSWFAGLTSNLTGYSGITREQAANLFNQINQSVQGNPQSPFRQPSYVLTFFQNLARNNFSVLSKAAPGTLYYYKGGSVLTSGYQ